MIKKKEILVLGFALFAMFFGAGNLIFPPSLGVNAGSNWLMAGIGFLITGVGLPLLGVLAFTKCRSLDDFSSKVSPKFNTLFCTVLILVIGPLFALPRTGSTTFELAIAPLLGGNTNLLSASIFSVVFFALTYVLTIKENKITDIIGKYMTPVILLILAFLFVKGLTTDLGTAVPTNLTGDLFAFGFINGYQTMDALASILFGIIIVKGLEDKGITNISQQQSYLVGAGIIAAIGLGAIYIFLIYFGSLVSGVDLPNTTSPALYLAENILGSSGRVLFGICVGFACLTTAVGLTALTADWFTKFTSLSYNKLVLIITLFSMIIAVGGVDMIVQLSVPMLLLLYPITIVLILMNLFSFRSIYFKLGTYTTLVISLVDVLGFTFNIAHFQVFIATLPLGSIGFSWLVPFLVSLVVAFVIDKAQTKKTA